MCIVATARSMALTTNEYEAALLSKFGVFVALGPVSDTDTLCFDHSGCLSTSAFQDAHRQLQVRSGVRGCMQ